YIAQLDLDDIADGEQLLIVNPQHFLVLGMRGGHLEREHTRQFDAFIHHDAGNIGHSFRWQRRAIDDHIEIWHERTVRVGNWHSSASFSPAWVCSAAVRSGGVGGRPDRWSQRSAATAPDRGRPLPQCYSRSRRA